MNILYISTFSSDRVVNDIYKKTGANPGFAIQKFARMLAHGFIKNGASVTALSYPPILVNYVSRLKFIVNFKNERQDGISFLYIPIINIPVIKNIYVFLYVFFYVLFWGIFNRKDKVIICDVLTIGASMGTLLASKLNKVKVIALVTDIFGLIIGSTSFKARVAAKLNQWYVKLFDLYVFLTEQMNPKINILHKPYIVMEALCDSQMHNDHNNISIKKSNPRVVLYAGGIYEQYGLKMLAEAFILANIPNAKLVYYGTGPYVEEYKRMCERYTNLEYRGVADNKTVMLEEYRATLLVNPRLSNEEYTQYSFPSKNMEFMSSGTPLLTTALPGMPREYYPYVFLFKDETLEGFAMSLKEVLSRSDADLALFGYKARSFVLDNKNNIKQAARILTFIKNNL